MTTVLITGANRGIGLELTRAFLSGGADVIATARDPGKAASLQALGKDNIGKLSIETLEVTSEKSIAGLAKRLDGRPIDILINNAGKTDRNSSVLKIDYEQFGELIAVNAIAPARISAALYPNVKASAQKKIVTITSQLGSVANNLDGSVPTYRATKTMVNQLMRSLAATAKDDGVTVLLLHPGWVKTDMGGPKAPVTPSDSAAGIRRVVEGATLAQTGSFQTFEGEALPW